MNIKPWRIEIGLLIGIAVGGLLWILSLISEDQNDMKPELIIVFGASGVFIADMWNRWRGIRKKFGEQSQQESKNIVPGPGLEIEGMNREEFRKLKKRRLKINKKFINVSKLP